MHLSYDNLTKYLQSLYFAIYGYIIEMINENRQDIQSEQQKIGMKVAEMTLHDVSTSLSTGGSSLSSQSSSSRINFIKSSPYSDENINYVEKFRQYFPNHRTDANRNFGENKLDAAEQRFVDATSRIRRMDRIKFDGNDTNKSFPLERSVDLESFERKYFENYDMPTAYTSSSSAIPSQSTGSILDLPESEKKTENLSKALVAPENNSNVNESHKRDDGKSNQLSVMYVGPRQFSADYQDAVSPSDDTPTLDLNKNSNGNDDEKGAGDGDSNIFDFENVENVILESFGFNAKAVKSSIIAGCVRSYFINLFHRTFEYFILM